jgi:uncharacterized protein
MTIAAPPSMESGLPKTDYYAPSFVVEVEGRELDPESKGDILELKVTMDLENLTSCDLTVNNWDDKGLTFKYSDTKIFDIGNRVHVSLGYADEVRSMLRQRHRPRRHAQAARPPAEKRRRQAV